MAMQQQRGRGGNRPPMKREKPEFDHVTLDLSRVTRVTKGGKHLSFRALVVIGDRKGRVGYGLEKGKDVQIAMDKSLRQAKKNMIRIPMVHETIPHKVSAKFKSASVLVKPAPRGSGIIAGSAVRAILDLAGVPNASGKILSRTHNPVTLTKATFSALSSFVPRVALRAQAVKAVVAEEANATAAKESATARKPRAKKETSET